MENPVDATDVAARLIRALTPAEQTAVPVLLVDAWEEVRGRVPNLDARFDAGLVTEGQVRKVVAAMVVRVLRNPEAIRQWTVDDDTFVRDTALSAGLLYVTPDEVSLLSGVSLDVAHISFSAPMPGPWSS